MDKTEGLGGASMAFFCLAFLTVARTSASDSGALRSTNLSNCLALFQTGDTKSYRYSLPPIPPERSRRFAFSFTVRARHNVFIFLAPEINSVAYYEIVIGGSMNTMLWIRRCTGCRNLVGIRKAALSASEARLFAVSYQDGTVNVIHGDQILIDYTDRNPLDIAVVGFSTGYGSTGEFIFNRCEFNSRTDCQECQHGQSAQCEGYSWNIGLNVFVALLVIVVVILLLIVWRQLIKWRHEYDRVTAESALIKHRPNNQMHTGDSAMSRNPSNELELTGEVKKQQCGQQNRARVSGADGEGRSASST